VGEVPWGEKEGQRSAHFSLGGGKVVIELLAPKVVAGIMGTAAGRFSGGTVERGVKEEHLRDSK